MVLTSMPTDNLPSSIILFTSLPADIGEGIWWASRTVMLLYPRRTSCNAVLHPQVPPPTIRMEEWQFSCDRRRCKCSLFTWRYVVAIEGGVIFLPTSQFLPERSMAVIGWSSSIKTVVLISAQLSRSKLNQESFKLRINQFKYDDMQAM